MLSRSYGIGTKASIHRTGERGSEGNEAGAESSGLLVHSVDQFGAASRSSPQRFTLKNQVIFVFRGVERGYFSFWDNALRDRERSVPPQLAAFTREKTFRRRLSGCVYIHNQ